jgi:UDP-glucose 4-epimerase
MRVGITGGSGQLGNALIRSLAADRRVKQIVSIDLHPLPLTRAKVTEVRADIRDPSLGKNFAGCDAVVHLAFLLSRQYAPSFYEDVNVRGSENVFRQALVAGVPHIVFSSSIAAYGVFSDHPVPLVEDSRRRFQQAFQYSAAKYQVEQLLDHLERDHPEVVVSRVRPGILVGSRMSTLIVNLMRRGLVPDTGAPLPLVWDEDVVEALRLVLQQRAGGTFNLCAREQSTAAELAAACDMRRLPRLPVSLARPAAFASKVLEAVGIGESFDAAWVRFGGCRMEMSTERARSVLGWKPRYDSSIAVLQRFRATAIRDCGARIVWFFRIVHLSGRFGPRRPELEALQLTLRLRLIGPGGAEIGLCVQDGRLLAANFGKSPVQAEITLPAALFVKLLAGKASWAQEQLIGRIQVEGQAHAPMVVSGIVSSFRARTATPGRAGMLPRLLAGWIQSGRES